MKYSQPPTIQVIDRLAKILEVLARYDSPASLKILAAESSLHPSTCYRILASLCHHNLVARDPQGHYRLGGRLWSLGERVSAQFNLQREARPVMEWLRDQVGETVNFTVREADEVVYVERALSPRMMRVEQLIGSRAPLHVTAVGKLMLGDGGPTACQTYAKRTGLPQFTQNTITDVGVLKQQAQQAIKMGYAYDNEEAELGVGCIGVLIRDRQNQAIAGLSVSAPLERRQDAWIPLLQAAGAQLSGNLGHVVPAPKAS